MMAAKGWGTWKTHGSMYQSGFPDLYCAHQMMGTRWIECKVPIVGRFTPAQIKMFPELVSKGVGIWVLVSATEAEYQKLFGPQNWYHFLRG